MSALRERVEHVWHSLGPAEVASVLETSLVTGLSSREAERRLGRNGPNEIRQVKRVSALRMLVGQFGDFMVLVLVAAAGVSLALGETADALAILAIVTLNGVLGFLQEYRAERSLEALKELAAPSARVIRGGVLAEVKAREVVPGDLLVVGVGDRIPADARLVDAMALEAEESALTGESLPVSKRADVLLPAATPLADRRNMVFTGTVVTRGHGKALVVATGMDTEIGRIAHLMQEEKDDKTPLQQRLEHLGRTLVLVCVGTCALVSAVGVLRGEGLVEMFLAGVSLAVAAIPEGLPAIVTIALALGVQRMSGRNAIVRRLPAVETLGCTTVICSDKTGTLTRNEMTLTEFDLVGRVIGVTGTGYSPHGQFVEAGRPLDPTRDDHLSLALRIGLYCNNAKLTLGGRVVGPEVVMRPGLARPTRRGSQDRWGILGDPTEGAFVVAAAKAGMFRHWPPGKQHPTLLHEIPFDSDRKMMTAIYENPAGAGTIGYVKGAPEVVAGASSFIYTAGRVSPMTAHDRELILLKSSKMASRGLRVLALGYRELPRPWSFHETGQLGKAVETNLVFVGLAGMVDPPREDVKRAIKLARGAGIRTVMVTGDHAGTALAVARSLELSEEGGRAITGQELDRMSDEALSHSLGSTVVFARVSPEHKLRIVRTLRAQGHIVAMTGDGVNDAPALREADIGVAMGMSGTDVTREAAAMVLADDNYATIVAAVEEGRGIYDNIRKFIRYLLACNAGEVLAMLIAVLAGLPLPLVPMQILWMNLVTDGLPAIALGVDPVDPDVMTRRPRRPKEGVFSRGLGLKIASQGVFIGVCTIAAFLTSLFLHGDLTEARTVAFTCLVMAQLFYVFHCRSEYRSVVEMNPWSNPYLVGAVLVSTAMQLAAVYWPALQEVFHTTALDGLGWLLVLVFSGWSSALAIVARKARRALWRRIHVVRA
ncbi:MAG: cation-translocating P-type ATPase [Firmicutes bacterium]|nr:cation-translocating P-type ATPase [Bacillota bacterium]MDH7495045.1 cation-translocating P-type ATPase [Bacillota bacterium]